jgi:hypothetical protein
MKTYRSLLDEKEQSHLDDKIEIKLEPIVDEIE